MIRPLDRKLGEPAAEQERRGSNFTVQRIGAESVPAISRIHRMPVFIVGKAVYPTRAKLDCLLVRIEGSVGYMVHISPEWMVEEWNLWKNEHKRNEGGIATQ